MRTIDLWFVCFQVWLAVSWHKADGPAWIPIVFAAFLFGGMVYIYLKRRPR